MCLRKQPGPALPYCGRAAMEQGGAGGLRTPTDPLWSLLLMHSEMRAGGGGGCRRH